MPQTVRTASIVLLALLSAGALSRVFAQETSRQDATSANPACRLLSVEQARTATGRQDYTDRSAGDAPGEGIGGGSSCQYGAGWLADGPPEFGLVLIPRAGKPSSTENGLKQRPRSGCERDVLSGIGDVAYLELCPTDLGPRVYVKSGDHDMIVLMNPRRPATPASVKPLIVKVARAAAANMP